MLAQEMRSHTLLDRKERPFSKKSQKIHQKTLFLFRKGAPECSVGRKLDLAGSPREGRQTVTPLRFPKRWDSRAGSSPNRARRFCPFGRISLTKITGQLCSRDSFTTYSAKMAFKEVEKMHVIVPCSEKWPS